MKKKNELKTKKEMIIESLQFPKDVILGELKVNITGRSEAWIENYKGIIEYTEDCILLQGKRNTVAIEGKSLSIVYYTNEDMKISGQIDCIHFK